MSKSNVLYLDAPAAASSPPKTRVAVTNARPRPRRLTALALGFFVAAFLIALGALLGWGTANAQPADDAAPSVVDAAPAVIDAPAEAGSGAGTASGSTLPTADDPDGLLLAAYKAIVNHDWWALVAVFLVGLVWLSRQPWALGRVPWFMTDRGGAVLALGIAFAGMVSHAIAATGGAPTLAALWAGAKIAGLGVGLYTLLKKLIAPAPAKG